MTTAIRMYGIGRYFGPTIKLKQRSPGAVWQHFRGILGGGPTLAKSERHQRSIMVPGQVLKYISLDIEKGTVVCLAGASGSGKSVLLKILAGTLLPTEGRAELFGTVASLLEAGENLDQDLTAAENIEIERRWSGHASTDPAEFAREVIAFAGIERFAHIPVRQYSSGMAMRLSLALALHGKPDILLLDDILGVGDIAFQQCCVERLLALKAAGCTMVLSLSDEVLVCQLATRIITLGGGGIVGDEAPSHLFPGQRRVGAADVSWEVAPRHPENDAAALRAVTVDRIECNGGPEIDVAMDFDMKIAPQRCRPSINILSGRVRVLRSLHPTFIDVQEARTLRFTVRVPVNLLSEGTYVIAPTLVSRRGQNVYSLKHSGAVTIEVRPGSALPEGGASPPLLAPGFLWEIQALENAP